MQFVIKRGHVSGPVPPDIYLYIYQCIFYLVANHQFVYLPNPYSNERGIHVIREAREQLVGMLSKSFVSSYSRK